MEKEIERYEEVRTQFESNRVLYKEKFQTIAAQWEVRVVLAHEEAKDSLRKFEEETIETFTPDMKFDYDTLKNKVKVLQGLKRHFSM